MAYPGLDPIKMLDYPLGDVIDLTREHLDHNRRAQAQQNIQRPGAVGVGQPRVIRRPADDSWF